MFTLKQFQFVFFLNLLFLTGIADAIVINGVETDPSPMSATANSMNFDPPCLFANTLPLMGAPYMDPATQSVIIDGEGAVLNECSNFGVSGYSAPNFLAWNCSTANNDGTVPALPLEMKFSRPIASLSIKVASSANAGSTARLRLFNAAHVQTGIVNVALTPATQTLSLARAGTRYMRLEGPCQMVADDLAVTY